MKDECSLNFKSVEKLPTKLKFRCVICMEKSLWNILFLEHRIAILWSDIRGVTIAKDH